MDTMQSEFDLAAVQEGSSPQNQGPPFMMANSPAFLIDPGMPFTYPSTSPTAPAGQQPFGLDQGCFSASPMDLQALEHPDATHIVALPFHTASANMSTGSLSTGCVPQTLMPTGDSKSTNYANLRPLAPRLESQGSIDAPLIPSTPRATKQQRRARGLGDTTPSQASPARNTEVSRVGGSQPSPSQPESASKKAHIDWATWTETISHFYLVENHTAQEVSFEMWALYGEQVAPGTLFKRFTKKQKRDEKVKHRDRSAASLPQGAKGTLSAFLFTTNKRLVVRLREGRIPPKPSDKKEPYACQHAMLHAIDCLVKKCFDTSKSTTATTLTAEGCSPQWQLVSDRCDGLVALISGQAPLGSKVLFLLGQLRQALDRAVATAHDDTGFLILIWRTCVTLLDVRFPGRTNTNRSIFLRTFLHWLRTSLLARLRNPKDNSVILVECLIRVLNSPEPYHFTATLGVGCAKTMDMMGGMVGHGHAVLLTMGSSCARYWKRDFSINRNLFEEQYKPLVDRVANSLRPTRADIAALYAYTQAQADSKAETTSWYAARLRIHSLDSCLTSLGRGLLRYSQDARALAFSTQLLVVCQLDPVMGKAGGGFDRNRFGNALHAVGEAIEVLRQGDRDCLVSAAHLSKRLSIWYKSYPGKRVKETESKSHRVKGRQTTDEKRRTAAILAQIGEPPVEFPKFRDPIHKPNTRWRRKRWADHQFVLSETTAESQLQDAIDVNYKDLFPGNERRQKKNKQPTDAETAQVSWILRRCRHCTETFPSRAALSRHVKEGCAERHPWSMD